MPRPSLTESFDAAVERHSLAVEALVPLLLEMTGATVADALPGAAVLETDGEMNEDWAFTLRIRRVLDGDGVVLYDIDSGHDDPDVEHTIDMVGFEDLDRLLDLTGDEYLGRRAIPVRLDVSS